jgi:hypothetical protein
VDRKTKKVVWSDANSKKCRFVHINKMVMVKGQETLMTGKLQILDAQPKIGQRIDYNEQSYIVKSQTDWLGATTEIGSLCYLGDYPNPQNS